MPFSRVPAGAFRRAPVRAGEGTKVVVAVMATSTYYTLRPSVGDGKREDANSLEISPNLNR